jgi:hemerythrin-like domain-containing protein
MDVTPAVPQRRALLAAAAAAFGLSACARNDGGDDVSAVEDLMREHGVLRRLIIVYRESAGLIRANFSAVDAAQIVRAADLFKRFGEDYHETRLEEQHIFPQVLKAGGEAARLVSTLIAQHVRGREITAYVRARCATGKISAGDAEPVARALETFARMYEAHAAYEDTIVFQAWKTTLSKGQLKETADQFEHIEKAAFNGDGFDMAAAEVAAIEQALGLHDLSRYTAQAPGQGPQGVVATPEVKEGGD